MLVYKVKLETAIEAKDRHDAWRIARAIFETSEIEANREGFTAQVFSVSTEPDPDLLAINDKRHSIA